MTDYPFAAKYISIFLHARESALRRSYPDEGPEASCGPNVVAGLARALTEPGTMGWDQAGAPAIACE